MTFFTRTMIHFGIGLILLLAFITSTYVFAQTSECKQSASGMAGSITCFFSTDEDGYYSITVEGCEKWHLASSPSVENVCPEGPNAPVSLFFKKDIEDSVVADTDGTKEVRIAVVPGGAAPSAATRPALSSTNQILIPAVLLAGIIAIVGIVLYQRRR